MTKLSDKSIPDDALPSVRLFKTIFAGLICMRDDERFVKPFGVQVDTYSQSMSSVFPRD